MPPGLDISYDSETELTNKEGNCLPVLVFAQSAVSHLRFVFCEAYKFANQSADIPLKNIPKPNTSAGGAVAMATIKADRF